ALCTSLATLFFTTCAVAHGRTEPRRPHVRSEPKLTYDCKRGILLLTRSGRRLSIFFERLEMRLEPNLCDESGHDGAADNCGYKDRVLLLIDDVVCQAEQCRN